MPPALDGELLGQLLAQGEHEGLDFKATIDLDDRYDVVSITKDIAAMSSEAGFLVIGVEEDGSSSGRLEPRHISLLDEARLRGKVGRYLPEPLALASAVVERGGDQIVIVWIGRHPQGFVVLAEDGTYMDGDKTKFAFRKGEVYVRHGSASEVWQQHDIERIFRDQVAAARDEWREELKQNIHELGLAREAQEAAAGPADVLNWQLDADSYERLALELIRAGDRVALQRGLDRLSASAREQVRVTGDADEFDTTLDRAVALAAIGVGYGDARLARDGLQILFDAYAAPYRPEGWPEQTVGNRSAIEVWKLVVERAFGLGALAVRRSEWETVRAIAAHRPPDADGYYASWLRHMLTMASRANAFQEVRDQRVVEVALLDLAQQHVARLAALRPDLAADDRDRQLNSLCQFDVLACLAAIDETGDLDDRSWYPNFSSFERRRAEPAVVALLTDQRVRSVIFRRDDAFLARALFEVTRLADRAHRGFMFGGSWSNPTVVEWVERGRPA